MRHFIHSGDLGDVIYSLPTVRAMGGGIMRLTHLPGMTAHGMTFERVNAIMPLLREQPYLADAVWSIRNPLNFIPPDGDEVIDLNRFRFMGFDLCRGNLADNYLKAEGLPTLHRDAPWLTAVKTFYAPVVISRSARYHNPDFPWRKVVEKFGRDAVFVGTPAEHAAFVVEFGDIPYAHTPTLLHAARIINAADLFIGNQSCPLAIAHGLGKNVLIEVCPACPNCIFNRPGEFTGWGDFDLLAQETDGSKLCRTF